ncbi:uncharacterized protein [Amphiura filiformis]|uniref:uncharacterized protein n=1 Tax=Amphiura filiformis TaxID=82378 RepID=UPI003B225783
MITGFIGTVSNRNKRDIIAGYLLTSIVSVGCAAGQIYWEGDATAATKCRTGTPCLDFNLSFVLHFMAIIVAFVEIVTALVATSICSYAICCRHPTTNTSRPTSEKLRPHSEPTEKPKTVEQKLPKSWQSEEQLHQMEPPRFVYHPRRSRVNYQYY